jgi:hypothetical protein
MSSSSSTNGHNINSNNNHHHHDIELENVPLKSSSTNSIIPSPTHVRYSTTTTSTRSAYSQRCVIFLLVVASFSCGSLLTLLLVPTKVSEEVKIAVHTAWTATGITGNEDSDVFDNDTRETLLEENTDFITATTTPATTPANSKKHKHSSTANNNHQSSNPTATTTTTSTQPISQQKPQPTTTTTSSSNANPNSNNNNQDYDQEDSSSSSNSKTVKTNNDENDNDENDTDDNVSDEDDEPPEPIAKEHVLEDTLHFRQFGISTPQQELKISRVMSNLQSKCPNWSPSFTRHYAEQCGYWIERFQQWENELDINGLGERVSEYKCFDGPKCHGLGDRFAGLYSVLNVAIHTNRTFRLQWRGLNSLFSPCILKRKWTTGNSRVQGCFNDKKSCTGAFTFGKEGECDGGPMQPRVYSGLDRACAAPGICKELRSTFQQFTTTAQVFGCALRAMLEPTEHFLQRKIPLLIGTQAVKMSVGDVLNTLFTRYYIIAIHFRTGDAAMLDEHDDVKNPGNGAYQVPFRCAQTIQSYREGRIPPKGSKPIREQTFNHSLHYGEEFSVDGRPVKWFIASDSQVFREMAIRMYGSRVIIVDVAPRHISHIPDAANDLVVLENTVAEWMFLGAADELLLNKLGNGLFHGRLSSFPKTAWVYNLKHAYYDSFTCRLKSFPYEGNWLETSTRCQSDLTLGKIDFLQPHLDPIIESQNPFPKVYVRDGNLVTSN